MLLALTGQGLVQALDQPLGVGRHAQEVCPGDKLQKVLNDHAAQGWQLKTITAVEVKGRVGPGGVEGVVSDVRTPSRLGPTASVPARTQGASPTPPSSHHGAVGGVMRARRLGRRLELGPPGPPALLQQLQQPPGDRHRVHEVRVEKIDELDCHGVIGGVLLPVAGIGDAGRQPVGKLGKP